MALSLDHTSLVKQQSFTACFLRSILELIWSTYFGGDNMDFARDLSISESDNRLYFAGDALTNNAILDPNTDDLLPNYDFDINNANDYWQEFPTPVASYPAWAAFFDLTEVDEFLKVEEMDDEIENSNLSIYPNPFNNSINIYAEESIETIVIYDLSGKVIYDEKSVGKSTHTLRVGLLSTGTYVIKVHTFSKVHTKKLIKL